MSDSRRTRVGSRTGSARRGRRRLVCATRSGRGAEDGGCRGDRQCAVNLPSEVLAHAQLTARNRWRDIDTPVGPITALLPPPVISGFDPPMGAIPGLGQHTDSVLAELGLGEDEIVALREHGAIGPAYE